MKDDETWSDGPLESAAHFAGAIETDCSGWDAEIAHAEWSEGQFESAAIPVFGAGADVNAAGPVGNGEAIRDEAGLIATRERIARVLDRLAGERLSGRSDEFAGVSRACRAEVERLQREVLDYLTQPAGNAG